MRLGNDIESIGRSVAGEINKASRWFIALGVFLVVAGVAMLANPLYAGLRLATVIGFLLVLAGASYLLNAFLARGAGGFLYRVLLAAVNIAAGVWLLTQPAEGLTALTILLGIALAIGGALKILFARTLVAVPGAGMVVFSGLVSIVLAILIFAKLPVASDVAVGVLIGVDFIFSGSSLTFVAIQAKQLTGAVATPS